MRQQLSLVELIDHILSVTGKDAARVREVLRQGTIVNGASRFRWEPLEATAEEIVTVLQLFPDARPDLPFSAVRCVRARLTGGRAAIEIDREAASRRRWLKRRSFWDVLLETAARLIPIYQHYSYADRSDVYHCELSAEACRELRDQSRLLAYSSLEIAVREGTYKQLQLWVER